MNRETASRACERGIAGLVLAMLVFSVLATGAVRTLEFLILQGMATGVLLLWLARLWIDKRPRFFWPPLCWAVLAFVVYAVARYATADIEYVARQELLRVLIYAGVFFAILNNLQRPETINFIVRVMLLVAMGVAGYALYQYMTGDSRVWHFVSPYETRGTGTYINPNHLAGFLELILPVGLAYVLVGRGKQPVTRILTAYALLVIAVGLAVSFSRGGWISTGVALAVFFGVLIFQRRYRWPAVAVLTVSVLLGITFFSQNLFSKYRLAKILNAGEVNTGMRLALWKPAVEMWRENVWFGVGPAHFDHRFMAYRPAEVQTRPERVHNDYLNTLADWGVVGVCLVAAAWVLAGIGVVRCWRGLTRNGDMASDGSDRLAFLLGASCALLAILTHALTDYNMHIPANALLVVVWLAFLSTQLRFVSHRAWVRVSIVVRGLGSIVLLGTVGYFLWQGQVGAREYQWLQRAGRAAEFSDAQVEAMECAFEVEPMNFNNAYRIGEVYRGRSWKGEGGYQAQAETALEWFGRSMELNPYSPYAPLRSGMCLDWLGRTDEAGHYYSLADERDPRGYYIAANIGWHYVHLRDYPAAQAWFERSKRLQWNDNELSDRYLEIIREQMLNAATNPLALPLLIE